MPQPPRHPHVLEQRPEQRLLRRVRLLEERLERLERDRAPIPTVSAPPTEAARSGALAVYESGGVRRLYVRVGGAWQYATLT